MNVNVFGYENQVYSLHISKKSHTKVRSLLLTTKNDKSHYVFIKGFNRIMFSTTKHKDKKHFCMHCLQNVTTEEVLSNHKKQRLLINGCQALNYDSGTIKFINHNKQIPECFLKRTNSYEGEYTIKYQ